MITKTNRLLVSIALGAAAFCFAAPMSVTAQTVRIHGAVTLSKMISERQAALETQTGLKFEVVGNGSGRGLANLTSGQADIAVLAGSLKGAADVMNREKPNSVDASVLKEVPITNVKIVFVAHPSAGAKKLTEAQARDILTGKIANWKDVGGADQPIKVVLAFAGDGTRVTVQEKILNGAEFAKDAIVRNSSKDIAPVITQLPGSVSLLSEKNATGLTTLAYEKDLQMPCVLVTKGEPAGDVKKAVDAIKGAIK